jgi:hypothetical protein
MSNNSVLKCDGCGANLELSGDDQSSVRCGFCNATTVVAYDAREDAESSPLSREVVMAHLQPLHRVGGVLFAAVFGCFLVRAFGLPLGVLAAILYWVLDLALVTIDSRIGKVRLTPAEILLVNLMGTYWKPRLKTTELGTCIHCGFQLAERGGACKHSPTKLHRILEITSTGDIDLAMLGSVPLAQDKSIWLVAVTIGLCWVLY